MKNWSDYPIFLAAVETGSLTSAGRKLGLSQPTIGRRIRALENDFGTPLLKREGGQLIPTEFGRSIIEHIRRMQDEASAIDRNSASLEDGLAGVVRLSATEGIGTSWLPAVLQYFRKDYPDVTVELNIGFKDFNLAQREADIALRWGSPGDQNSLIGRKVGSVQFGLFASPKYLAQRGVPKIPQDLMEHDGVLAQIMGGRNFWMTDDDGNMICPPKRVTMTTNSIWTFDQALGHGYGIGVLPLVAVQPGNNRLVRVLGDMIAHTEDLYLVSHQDLRRSSRIRSVFDFLVQAFKDDAKFLMGEGGSSFGNVGFQSRGLFPTQDKLHVAE